MSISDRVFSRSFDNQYNLLIYFLLVVAFAGSIFLAWKGVQAGIIYTLMLVGVLALVFLGTLFVRDDRNLGRLGSFLRVPFSTSTGLGALFFLVFLLVPVFVNLVVGFFTSAFRVTALAIPLFGSGINTAFQSFSAAEIGSSVSWQLFTVVFTAGTIETFVFSFGMMVVGVLSGLFVYGLLTDRPVLWGLSQRNWVLSFAILLSVAGFTGAHLLNGTYTGLMFLVAAVFLLISNVSIYYAGVFLSGWIGYHMSNNFIWLVEALGWQKVFVEGLLSWFGLFFLGFIALLLWFVVRRWSFIRGELSGLFNG